MATTKDNPKLKNVYNFNIPDAKEFDMIDWLYENPQLVDKMNMANKQVKIEHLKIMLYRLFILK